MVIPSPLDPSPVPQKSHPVSTTPINTGLHRSRLVRTVCTRRACKQFGTMGTRGTIQTGNRCAMTTITLKHFFFGGQFGKHATISKLLDPVEPSPSYQKSVRINLIFVAPIIDGSIFYQKYFLDLIVLVSGVYDIFFIFASEKTSRL